MVVGRQRGFTISLTAWLIIASVVIGGIIGFELFIADDYIVLALELPIGGGFALGVLAVNVPGAFHLALLEEDTHPVPLSYRIVGSFFLAATLVAVLVTGGVFLFVAMGPGRDVRQVDSLALSPDFERDGTLFARAGDQGVLYRSTNAGASWRRAFDPPPGFLAHPPLALSPARSQIFDLPGNASSATMSPAFENDRTVFAFRAYDPHRVYRSTDGGVTWKQVLDRFAFSIEFSPVFETDRTLFAATAVGGAYSVYRSTNGGDSWEKVNGGLSYNWATKPALIMGVGFGLLLGGAILFTRHTGDLRSITFWWRVLWLAAGLEVGILLLTTGYTLGAPALLVRGFYLQLMALVGLGLFILAILVVGFMLSIGTVVGREPAE